MKRNLGSTERGRLDITSKWDDIQGCIITCWAVCSAMGLTARHTILVLALFCLAARPSVAASSKEYVLWFVRDDAEKKGEIAAFQAVARSRLSDTNTEGCLLLVGNGRHDLLKDFPRRGLTDGAVQHMTYLYASGDLAKGFEGRTWFGVIDESNASVEEALFRIVAGVSNAATLTVNFLAFTGSALDLAQTNLLWASSTNIVVRPGGWRHLTFTLSPEARPARDGATTHFALSVETRGAPCVISSGSFGQPDVPARLEEPTAPVRPVLPVHKGQPVPRGAPSLESSITLQLKPLPNKAMQP